MLNCSRLRLETNCPDAILLNAVDVKFFFRTTFFVVVVATRIWFFMNRFFYPLSINGMLFTFLAILVLQVVVVFLCLLNCV